MKYEIAYKKYELPITPHYYDLFGSLIRVSTMMATVRTIFQSIPQLFCQDLSDNISGNFPPALSISDRHP